MRGDHFYIAFSFYFLYKRTHPPRYILSQASERLKGGVMTKIIMGLLIVVVLVLCFLLFWIVILSAALLFFGRGESKGGTLINEKPRTT